MKTKLVIVVVLIIFCEKFLIAQSSSMPVLELSSKSYTEAMNSSFKSLKRDSIPYRTLYNRVFGWSKLEQWRNGDTTSFNHIKQAWYDLLISQEKNLNSLSSLKKEVAVLAHKNIIPIVVINSGLSYLDPKKIKDGSVKILDNQITFSGKKPPYIKKRVHLAAFPLKDLVQNKHYELIFHHKFILSNLKDEKINNIKIHNISTNQKYEIHYNEMISINFMKSGPNLINFKIKTNKGEYLVNQVVNVISDNMYGKSNFEPYSQLLKSKIKFKGYSEYNATISYADYHIYYHYKNNDPTLIESKLKKPIVILDGFDPEDVRNYKSIYDTLLVYDNNKKLGEELRLMGYDVIILNFPMTGSTEIERLRHNGIDIPLINGQRRDGGTDYIERNSLLLVELIQKLNTELSNNGSNEQLVIVGPSMGGLISRYALAYMEKNNLNHNTRLWVSFDSPHLGANIPVAAQYNLYFFGYIYGNNVAEEAYEKTLHSIAARQMLIEQIHNLNRKSSFFKKFYQNLNGNGTGGSRGFPVNLRKVALINGSGLGYEIHELSEYFLQCRGKLLGTTVVKIDNRFLPDTNSDLKIFKAKAFKKDLDFHHGLEVYVTNSNPNGSMDIVPGGTYNVQRIIKDQISSFLDEYNLTQHWSLLDNHCFIPSISSLAFNNYNFKWTNLISDRDLVEYGEIPFDNYFMPSNNQSHMKLTKESVFWLLNQLKCNHYNQYRDMTISGPSTICGNSTFQINYVSSEIPPIEWFSSSYIERESAQGSNPCIFSGEGFGSAWLQARIGENGLFYTLPRKSLWLDNINPMNIGIFDSNTGMRKDMFCSGKANEVTAKTVDGEAYVNLWDWDVTGGQIYYRNSDNSKVTIYPLNSNFNVRVRAQNNCGWSQWTNMQAYSAPCPRFYKLAISTDHVNNLAMVSLNYVDNLVSKNVDEWEIEIFDWNSSKTFKKIKVQNSECKINTTNFLPGVYVVKVKINNQILSDKFIVN